MWSPDPRTTAKLDDWSSADFLAIPLPQEDLEAPIDLLLALKGRIFTRDLFYETTPVSGDKFFGRRPLLQSLRDDIRDRRVSGLFGLRKAGKTSVLAELKQTVDGETSIFVLRDLESLPSPPQDPIPGLIAALVTDLTTAFTKRDLPSTHLREPPASLGHFRRARQTTLSAMADASIDLTIALDEIEFITPSDRIDVREGDMPSIAQFLSILRSLVQENRNLTFLIFGLTRSVVQEGRLYGRPNPLFSWAKQYYLSPLTSAETAQLARAVGQRMGVYIEDGALGALYEATGGHAYLYRHLASTVVATLPVEVMTRTMARRDVLAVLEPWRREVASVIDEMVKHVQRYYPDEGFLLEMLSSSPDEFRAFADDMPVEVGHLIRLGLVQHSEGFSLSSILELR